MIAPIHTKPLNRNPKSEFKSKTQFEEYLEYVSKPSPSWSLSKYLKAFVVTIISSVTLFYTVGPDQASVNNRLIIRYNNAQLTEKFIAIKHLRSPMPWENKNSNY